MLQSRLLSGVAFLSVFAIGIAIPSIVSAQTVAPSHASQLSIDGLTLGMTMDQARTAIKANNPDMIVLTGYATENEENAPQYYATLTNNFGQSNTGPLTNFENSKVKVPVELTAIKFVGYDPTTGAALTDGNAALTYVIPTNAGSVFSQGYGGDFLRLEFTPTDNGGKLYAIIKTHFYPTASEEVIGSQAEPGVPTYSQIVQTAQQKYGAPSHTDNSSAVPKLYWIYDSRGRPLPGTHPDVQTCLQDVSTGTFANISTTATQFVPGTSALEHDPFKFTAANVNSILQQAAKDTSGEALEAQYKSTVDTLVQGLINSAAASFSYPPSANNATLGSCDVTSLEVSFSGGFSPSSYQEILMKENTALYDNGASEYVQKKLSEVNGGQRPAAAPSL